MDQPRPSPTPASAALGDLIMHDAEQRSALGNAVRDGFAAIGKPLALGAEAIGWALLLRNQDRCDYRDRATFRLSLGQKVLCHLSVGRSLDDIWARSQAFAVACPAIACRPLFLRKVGGLDCLASEYFEGESLEALVCDGRLSAVDALTHASTVLSALEATSEPSTLEKQQCELRSFFDQVLASQAIGDLDGRFLQAYVFPLIFAGAEQATPVTHWSNGDIVARNILVDGAGQVRLVDYEFASRTHFIAEGWWRWRTFSLLPEDARSLPAWSSAMSSPWLECYFALRQIILSHENSVSHLAVADVQRWVDRLSSITVGGWDGLRPSLFLRGWGDVVRGYPNNVIKQKDHEIDECRRRLVALDQEVYDRGEWGQRLDRELSELRQQSVARDEQAGRLQSEKAVLEAELSKVECARRDAEKVVRELESKVAALDREVYDRGEWGQRLDRELSELRQQAVARDEQAGRLQSEKAVLEAELSTVECARSEAEKVVRELESKVAALDREVYDRGEWGKRLDEELSELRQQAVARDEQAGRLQSEKAVLEAELSKVECARSEAEKSVRELESKVAALEREVYDRGEWGQRLDDEISELRQQLTLRDEQVGGLKNEKLSLTAELKKVLDDYHALQEKELFIMKDIEQLRAELAQQASALAEISRREVEARDREDACLRRETAREARLQQTEVALTCSEEQLMQAQNTLNAVLADAEDKLRWAASLDKELNRLRVESSALKVIQDRQIEQLRDKVSRMQRSVSWNLTAPLRALRRVILNR